MKYFPSFRLIRRAIELSTARVELWVDAAYKDLVKLPRTLISGIEVNEARYLKNYKDVAGAVREAIVRSTRQHFVDEGYLKGRLSFPIIVYENWNLARNPDVAKKEREADVVTAQSHFDQDCYREGRLPVGI